MTIANYPTTYKTLASLLMGLNTYPEALGPSILVLKKML
jgi:hypothetical protein